MRPIRSLPFRLFHAPTHSPHCKQSWPRIRQHAERVGRFRGRGAETFSLARSCPYSAVTVPIQAIPSAHGGAPSDPSSFADRFESTCEWGWRKKEPHLFHDLRPQFPLPSPLRRKHFKPESVTPFATRGADNLSWSRLKERSRIICYSFSSHHKGSVCERGVERGDMANPFVQYWGQRHRIPRETLRKTEVWYPRPEAAPSLSLPSLPDPRLLQKGWLYPPGGK